MAKSKGINSIKGKSAGKPHSSAHLAEADDGVKKALGTMGGGLNYGKRAGAYGQQGASRRNQKI